MPICAFNPRNKTFILETLKFSDPPHCFACTKGSESMDGQIIYEGTDHRYHGRNARRN